MLVRSLSTHLAYVPTIYLSCEVELPTLVRVVQKIDIARGHKSMWGYIWGYVGN